MVLEGIVSCNLHMDGFELMWRGVKSVRSTKTQAGYRKCIHTIPKIQLKSWNHA